MSKDPAFLFYSSDFLTGTMFLSDEQVGKYIRLLCSQHQHGHMTKKDMMKICKTYDEDVFEKFVLDEDGKYYNDRLEREIMKRVAYSESRRKNRTVKDKDMSNTSSTYDEHMENENINRDIEDKESAERERNITGKPNTTSRNYDVDGILQVETIAQVSSYENNDALSKVKKVKRLKNISCPIWFDSVWNEYPRKEGKSAITKESFVDLEGIGKDKVLGAVRQYNEHIKKMKTEAKYVLMGSTFFNGRYKDYIETDSRQCQLEQPKQASEWQRVSYKSED